MAKGGVMWTLVGHFFRRFFDNDTVHVQGETLTTVVRAVAIVAAPGLLVAFFLQNAYPYKPFERAPWLVIQDHYFFVLYSFVAMGAVAVVEWEMLFPDRLDFLVLTPLSLKPRQLLASKAAALVGFLALFLFSANVFGAVVLPAVSKGNFYRQVWAHTVATGLAGMFAAFALLAVGGVMLCVFDPRRFRVASPLLQMLAVVGLVLLMVHYGRYGNDLKAILAEPLGRARWVVPYWFLGVYETLLHGSAAPTFAWELARHAYTGTAVAAGLVVVTYPLAWARMQRMAIEGVTRSDREPSRWWRGLVRSAVARPGERAVFHFIGQTIGRNARYQVYLAIYGGVGLALGIACAVGISLGGGRFRVVFEGGGLHAMLPLLLFWVVAGLRNAFALPLSLAAGWVFRVTGVKVRECAAAARRWVLWGCLAVTAAVVVVVSAAGWDVRRIVVQGVVGVCLGVLLTDAFFFSEEYVPFNRARMPGRTNFPLVLTLYIGILPLFVMGIVRLEGKLEESFVKLVLLGVGTALVHVGVNQLRYEPGVVEEELEGYDEEFQLLGLS
jgi:hypothetical protein